MSNFAYGLLAALILGSLLFLALARACDVSADEPLPIRPALPTRAPAVPVPAGLPTPPTGPAVAREEHAVGWANATITLPVIVRGPRHGAPLPILVGTGCYRPHAVVRPAEVVDEHQPEPFAVRLLGSGWRTTARNLARSTP